MSARRYRAVSDPNDGVSWLVRPVFRNKFWRPRDWRWWSFDDHVMTVPTRRNGPTRRNSLGQYLKRKRRFSRKLKKRLRHSDLLVSGPGRYTMAEAFRIQENEWLALLVEKALS